MELARVWLNMTALRTLALDLPAFLCFVLAAVA